MKDLIAMQWKKKTSEKNVVGKLNWDEISSMQFKNFKSSISELTCEMCSIEIIFHNFLGCKHHFKNYELFLKDFGSLFVITSERRKEKTFNETSFHASIFLSSV